MAVLVFDARRRLLLGRDAGMDLWATPGGAIDPDETPADAAVREMWEETGLLVTLSGVRGAAEEKAAGPEGSGSGYRGVLS